MASIIPNPSKIKPFKTQAAFAAWLAKSHAREGNRSPLRLNGERSCDRSG